MSKDNRRSTSELQRSSEERVKNQSTKQRGKPYQRRAPAAKQWGNDTISYKPWTIEIKLAAQSVYAIKKKNCNIHTFHSWRCCHCQYGTGPGTVVLWGFRLHLTAQSILCFYWPTLRTLIRTDERKTRICWGKTRDLGPQDLAGMGYWTRSDDSGCL